MLLWKPGLFYILICLRVWWVQMPLCFWVRVMSNFVHLWDHLCPWPTGPMILGAWAWHSWLLTWPPQTVVSVCLLLQAALVHFSYAAILLAYHLLPTELLTVPVSWCCWPQFSLSACGLLVVAFLGSSHFPLVLVACLPLNRVKGIPLPLQTETCFFFCPGPPCVPEYAGPRSLIPPASGWSTGRATTLILYWVCGSCLFNSSFCLLHWGRAYIAGFMLPLLFTCVKTLLWAHLGLLSILVYMCYWIWVGESPGSQSGSGSGHC
jgi:hypothetical protein